MGADDPVTDRHAHLRLDTLERDFGRHDTAITKLADTLTELDKNSAIRHATSQSQNEAILARLNQPSVIMSVIGDPAKVGGVVALLGALLSAAVALGYAQAPARPVLVPTIVAAPPALPAVNP